MSFPATRFLLLILTTALAVGLTMVVVFGAAGGYADEYYLRFAAPPQRSLILGTSRAAQGIHPAVLNRRLGREDMFNFAFTLGTTPYGPAYLDLIRRKLTAAPDSAGLFILAVDPWSLSVDCPAPGSPACLEENALFAGTLRTVSGSPNFDYLLNHYGSPYFQLLVPTSRALRLHPDGWLEVNIDTSAAATRQRTVEKLATYRAMAGRRSYAPVRGDYLKRTVRLLKERGDVYLVRLPVHPDMLELEREFMPGFQDSLRSWARQLDTPYLSFADAPEVYPTLDGNHLTPGGGERATARIARFIADR